MTEGAAFFDALKRRDAEGVPLWIRKDDEARAARRYDDAALRQIVGLDAVDVPEGEPQATDSDDEKLWREMTARGLV